MLLLTTIPNNTPDQIIANQIKNQNYHAPKERKQVENYQLDGGSFFVWLKQHGPTSVIMLLCCRLQTHELNILNVLLFCAFFSGASLGVMSASAVEGAKKNKYMGLRGKGGKVR